MNLLNLNPHPPTKSEILALPFLAVVAIALFQYVVYAKVKRLGYRATCREVLRLEMAILKSAIIDTSRMALLVLVMFLPLLVITWSTELSVIFVFYLIPTKVQSFPLLLEISFAYVLLFLLAVSRFIAYFFGRYGSIYKLPFLSLIRKDVRQYFSKHFDILMILLTGSVIYATTILVLLTDLIYAPSPLSKEFIGIIVAFLFLEVLRNKKYDNAFRLVEKIMKV